MTSKVILAVEDSLSKAVAERILAHYAIDVAQTIGLRGSGYLRTKARSLNITALGFPVFMLTDLDTRKRCPVDVVESWIGAPRNPGFLFRVAVMEIEAWVLADRDAFARFITVATTRLPNDADSIDDPKQLIINLVRRCKDAGLRRDLVPASGSTATIGPAYNARLTQFVATEWDPSSAAPASASLRRTLSSLSRFVEMAQRPTR